MQLIGKTKNGKEVYVDLVHSHAATHLKDTPSLLAVTKEALAMLELHDNYVWIDKDMGRIIGDSELVETQDGDEIVYAKRPNRDTFSRFVKNRKAEPASYITLELKKTRGDTYELSTTYLGRKVPAFPGNDYETPESKIFWSNHALAWGRQEILLETEMKDCPW